MTSTRHKTLDNQSDHSLATRLKRGSAQAGNNPWFTQRMLHRLPPKKPQGAGVIGTICYTLMVMVCAVGWAMVVLHGTNVVTVGNITFTVTLCAMTIGVICSMVEPLLKGD